MITHGLGWTHLDRKKKRHKNGPKVGRREGESRSRQEVVQVVERTHDRCEGGKKESGPDGPSAARLAPETSWRVPRINSMGIWVTAFAFPSCADNTHASRRSPHWPWGAAGCQTGKENGSR